MPLESSFTEGVQTHLRNKSKMGLLFLLTRTYLREKTIVYEKENKALKRAKLTLMTMKDTVFFSTILLSLTTEFDTSIPTACTNGVYIKINPTFWMDQSEKQKIGLLVHEVSHVAYDHMGRIGKRNPKKWNIAADIAVDNLLFENGFTMCDFDEYRPEFQDMSTEAIYAKLPKNPPRKGGGGKGIGNDIQYADSPEEQAMMREKVTEIVLRAAIQSQMSGDKPGAIPGEVAVNIKEVLNPELPWNILLQNYMSQFAKNDYSFMRQNRRFADSDIFLPSLHSEAICNIVAAFDISGSTSDNNITAYVAELTQIQQTLNPDKITILGFDTKIHSIQEFTQYSNIRTEIDFTGRGGTDIKCVLDWAKENQPTVLLIFSDGEFYEQTAPEEIPIIWVIHGDDSWKCSYGEVIHFNGGEY